MPHPAIGITLGALAAGAIVAVVAKEMIENWDEITDNYETFVDRMEDEHNVHLPRFRQRRYRYANSYQGDYNRAMHSRPSSSSATESFYQSSMAGSYATGREDLGFSLISRSERFSELGSSDHLDRQTTPTDARQLSAQEQHEADLNEAIARSLHDSTADTQFTGYDVPDYPKEMPYVDRSDADTPTAPEPAPVETPSVAYHSVSEDDETWSETWTLSAGSDKQTEQQVDDIDRGWSGSEFSHSDVTDDEAAQDPFADDQGGQGYTFHG